MSSKFLFVHPLGSPFAAQAAQALYERGALDSIITALDIPEHRVAALCRMLPAPLRRIARRELGRRSWIPQLDVPVMRDPLREIFRIALSRTPLLRMTGIRYQTLVDWVYAGIDRRAADFTAVRPGLSGVYCYEDGALAAFRAAKERGLACWYDLPIVHHREAERILRREAERFPEIAPAMQSLFEPEAKRERKDAELALADRVIAASQATARSLLQAGIPADRIQLCPYGAPLDHFTPAEIPRSARLPFRALFVGRVGPRKGVHYLLESWRGLHPSEGELQLVGVNEFPPGYTGLNTPGVRHTPSLPRPMLLDRYRSADVLVFPSLIEGFGMVILEAMACGLPVIATTATAAPEIIRDGVDGFVIDPADPAALAQRLEWCLNNRERLAAMGREARRRAEEFTWESYRSKLGMLLNAGGSQ